MLSLKMDFFPSSRIIFMLITIKGGNIYLGVEIKDGKTTIISIIDTIVDN